MTALRGNTIVAFLIVLGVTIGLLVVAIEGTDVSVTGVLVYVLLYQPGWLL